MSTSYTTDDYTCYSLPTPSQRQCHNQPQFLFQPQPQLHTDIETTTAFQASHNIYHSFKIVLKWWVGNTTTFLDMYLPWQCIIQWQEYIIYEIIFNNIKFISFSMHTLYIFHIFIIQTHHATRNFIPYRSSNHPAQPAPSIPIITHCSVGGLVTQWSNWDICVTPAER